MSPVNDIDDLHAKIQRLQHENEQLREINGEPGTEVAAGGHQTRLPEDTRHRSASDGGTSQSKFILPSVLLQDSIEEGYIDGKLKLEGEMQSSGAPAAGSVGSIRGVGGGRTGRRIGSSFVRESSSEDGRLDAHQTAEGVTTRVVEPRLRVTGDKLQVIIQLVSCCVFVS